MCHTFFTPEIEPVMSKSRTMARTKMSRMALFAVILMSPLVMNIYSCSPSRPSGGGSPPPGGFSVEIVDQNQNAVSTPHGGGTISGNWVRDSTTAGVTVQGSTTSFGVTPQPVSVSGGRATAFWSGTWNPQDATCLDPINFPNGTTWSTTVTLHLMSTVAICLKPPLGAAFALTNSLPSTMTVSGSGFSSSHGTPQLNLYDSNLNLISQVTATSVAPDGSSVTFPFPTNSGSALTAGHYGYNIASSNSSGTTDYGVSFLSVGTNDTSKQTPFGVDAFDLTQSETDCYSNGGGCYPWSNTNLPVPVVSYSSSGQVCVSGTCATVGSMPIAVKAYDVATVSYSGTAYNSFGVPEWTYTGTVTLPHYALVANYGSNNISVVNLASVYTAFTLPVVQTIAVGTGPMALAIKNDQTKAYVANYGGSTLSEIDLGSLTQSRTVSVGSSPAALALDPDGTDLWVGGQNYISKISLSSLTVTSTFSVSGQVTSLAISPSQNAFVYTTVSGSQNTFQTQHGSLSNATPVHSYVTAATSGTAYYNSGGGTTPGYVLSSAAMVSSTFGNRYSVTSTPTGFSIIDLETQTTMLAGATPSAVRGIAVDPTGQMIYLTSPESNSLISLPAPPRDAVGSPSPLGTQTPLTSYPNSDGSGLAEYLDSRQHVMAVSSTSGGAWLWQDLTALSGGPRAAVNSTLTSNVSSGGSVYQAADGHIHQIWWWSANSRWVDNDMTAANGATVAARSGTPLAAYSDSLGIHEVYIGQDNHIYDLFYNGSNSTLDLTSLSGGPGAAANSTLTSNVNSGGIVYQSADGHIHQIWWWSTNSRWVDNDMTAASGATVAARSGTPLAAYSDSLGIHEVYIGQDNHIYDLFYNGSNSTLDLTSLPGGPGAGGNSTLTSNLHSGGIVYQSADGHIHQIWYWSTNSRWVDNDMTSASSASVLPITGSSLTAFLGAGGIHEIYIGQDNHVYDLFYNGSNGGLTNEDVTGTATPH